MSYPVENQMVKWSNGQMVKWSNGQMVKWSNDSIDNCSKLDTSRPTFVKQWLLIYFLFVCTILSFTFPTFSPAEEETACNASECNYTVQFDHPGFYIAVVTLPPNQREGVWSLIIDPPTAHLGSFHGGGVLKENGIVPSWVAFSLAQAGVVYIDPFNYPNDPVPFRLELMKEQENKQYQSVWGPTLVNPGQRYTTTALEPGFYVAVANSTGPKDFFGLSLWNPTLFGGVSGGWLDSQTGVGFAALDITQPRTVNFKLWFGQIYGDLGAGQPHFQIYYQDKEGIRTLYWSAPQSLQPEYKPKPPSTQLPIDPNANWEDTVKFLYTGNNPVQTPFVDKSGQSVPINIDPNGAVIILGKVVNSLGQPLPGVKVTVEDCQECGQTLTAEGDNFIATGEFALAVNPGRLTVKYEKEGYVPLQRQVEIACSQTVSRINAIALVTRDEGGGLQLSQGSSAAQGGAVSDTAGSRQARLFFPPGTVATMVLPNCSEKQLVDPHIRITEYTQGDPGVEGESTGMPFELPPGTGYTYAVEFSVDEAVKENAREVKFNQPVISYVENFLGFPVGVPVPSGYYDYNLEAWIPSENGYVINILGGDASGQPLFDFAGQAIILSNEEKQQIVQWFGNEEWYQTKQGKSFWRTPLMHFSPIDLNYPRVPDPDAKDPDVPEAPDNDKKEEDPCEKSGCIIEAENQVLGEVLPVAGTPFSLNYRSNRVPGRKAAYALDIPLRTGTLPQSLKRIRLEIDIGGRRKIEEIFCNEQNPNVKDCNNPAPPVYYFVWDGKDDLGRPLPGSHTATIKIDYLYNAYYLFPADFAKSFGLEGTVQDNSVRVPARQEIAKSKSYTRQLGGLDARTTEGLGGWTLDIHHVYDNINGVLYEGSGGQRQVQFMPKPSKPEKPQPQPVAEPEPQPEPLPPQVMDLTDEMRVSYCIQQCTTPNQCVADCGKVLVGSAHVESDSVQWIGAESADSFAAKSTGDEAFGFTGWSRYLTESAGENEWLFQDTQSVSILNPHAFNDSPSLGFFFAPRSAGQLEATTIYSAAKAYEPTDPPKYGTGMKTVIVRGEGKADDKINPAITLDIALNDAPPVMADAAAQCVPATQETVFTVTPRLKRDSALLAEVQPVQQVIVDLEVKEKNTPQCSSFTDDMVTANNFAFGDYFHYLNEQGPNNPLTGCVRHYAFLVSVDKPFQFKALRQHDTQNDTYPKGFVQYAFSVRSHLTGNPAEYQGSYKKFHLASSSSNNRAGSLTSVRAGARSCSVTDNQLLFDGRVASQDGGLLYEFEQSRHVRTLDSLTGQAIYTFGYNDKGYLVKVTDIDGDVTTIERDANNHPVAMVAPYGQRTVLTLDANGYLASATNDAGEVHQLVSTADGLLTQYIDPRNNVEIYEYDMLGLFVKNTTPIGGGYTVAKTDLPNSGYVTTLTSREGRQSRYQITTKDGKKVRLNTAPDGTATISSEEGDGLKKVASPDGTEIWSKEKPDSRLVNIYTSPSNQATAIVTPGGLKAEIVTETATNPLPIADDYDPLNLKTLTNKVTVNGRTSSSVFDKTAKTITATSAAGRKSVSVLDEKGRVVKEQVPGFVDTKYTYDTRGRLTQVSEGEGVDLRTASLEYDARGNISKVTDALGRQVSFDYDLVGRVTKQTLTDGRQILYSYDANGNVTTITPPSRPAHGFAYNGEDLQTQYVPPPAGLATPQTQYVYNLDQELTKVVRPDGQSIEFEYDQTKGRLNALNTPHGTYSYAYDDQSGNLTTVTAPDGNRLSYQYDGSLPLSVTWDGAIQGNLSVTYDNDFRVTATSINGGSTVNYDYDADSLLVRAGELWLVRDPENGLLKGTQLGGKNGIVTQRAYNVFGEMVSETATVNASPLYTSQYSYDKLGRITQKVETLEGVTTTFAYDYDPAGRLVKVTQNGAVTEQYSYDGNGNRLSAVTATHGSVTGSYDEQDRLLQYAGNTYSYTANGELLSKTSNGATTQYQYDVLGNLRSVKLPDGKQLEYVIDASGRRVGKKVNGVLTQGWLYQGSLNPIAELDGTGKVVTRFVYGSKANVPDYLVKGDKTYRIISDHLGSPRLVIDLSTGAIVQRMEYDAFGNVTQDSNPGFQPFGFAGGLYDSETQLVRFGARDYDAETGRWTAKDPIDFEGGEGNLYGYVFNDPVNFLDPEGKFWWILGQATAGAAMDLLIQMAQNGWKWECVDWGQVAMSAVTSVAFGAAGKILGKVVGTVIKAIKSTKATSVGKIIKSAEQILCGGSFVAGTLVHTESGLKPINEIKEGERVLSFDETTQTTSYQPVIALIQHEQSSEFVRITLQSGETLEATADHPFYVEGKGWITAKVLSTREILRLHNGQTEVINEIHVTVRTEKVYNLTVANNHSYFVGVEGVLVHNMCKVNPVSPTSRIPNKLPPKSTWERVKEAQEWMKRGRGNNPPPPNPPTTTPKPSGLQGLQQDTFTPGGGNQPSLYNPFQITAR